MKLTNKEFKAMNNPLRRLLQRGYGAKLIAQRNPRRYVGIDLMREQIDLALERNLERCEFIEGDVSDLSAFTDSSFDSVADFGILHHVPTWRIAVSECARVLRAGGLFVVEEPEGSLLNRWDKVFHWDHPEGGAFSAKEFEIELTNHGLRVERRHDAFGFFWLGARKAAA